MHAKLAIAHLPYVSYASLLSYINCHLLTRLKRKLLEYLEGLFPRELNFPQSWFPF